MIDKIAREEIDQAEESFIKELSEWTGKYSSEYAASLRVLRKLARSLDVARELHENAMRYHDELYWRIIEERNK